MYIYIYIYVYIDIHNTYVYTTMCGYTTSGREREKERYKRDFLARHGGFFPCFGGRTSFSVRRRGFKERFEWGQVRPPPRFRVSGLGFRALGLDFKLLGYKRGIIHQ